MNLALDEFWDPQDFNDQNSATNDFSGDHQILNNKNATINNFRRDSKCQTNDNKLGKVIEN